LTALLLFLFALLVGAAVAAFIWHRRGGVAPSRALPKRAGRALRRRSEHASEALAEADSRAETAVGLGAAMAALVMAGVVVGALAYLVRSETAIVRLDESVAEWGQAHAGALSTDVLEAITELGEPTTVAVMAAVLALIETVRTRNLWVAPFLLVVVAGNGIITTTIKNLADRVRPELNPLAETLGPSFPSGHSSWSAAFVAAAALLLGRGRSPRARSAIAGVAAALVAMVAGSRVLLGVHWLSDVIAGVAIGLAWFCVCAVAFGGRLLRFGAAADEAAQAAGGGLPGRSGLGVHSAPERDESRLRH
jgi:membrane-associated phospholipid phosphatase